MNDLENLDDGRPIITEGAAFLPDLMKMRNIPKNRYFSITPSRVFQISHYEEREWIHYALDGCKDEKKAFENWMERDCLFAQEINNQSIKNDYQYYVNNGETNIETIYKMVANHFEME